MPSKFFLDGFLGSLERTMQLQPLFAPRGGGKTRGYKYTAADCDCRYCIHAPKPRTPCGISMTDCPCFTERLETGCIPLTELLASLTRDIRYGELNTRINNLIAEREASEMFFVSGRHKALFNGIVKQGGLRHHADTGMLAALFLLTSNSFLWSRARFAVWRSRIAFEDINIRGITEAKIDNYAIYKAAKELCAENGEHHIAISELADEALVGKNAFRLITNALLIRRYGLSVIKSQENIAYEN
jgi:hypothetical protein